MRFFCWGEVVEKTVGGREEGRFEGLVGRMGKEGGKVEGTRAVVLLRVWKVCGFCSSCFVCLFWLRLGPHFAIYD